MRTTTAGKPFKERNKIKFWTIQSDEVINEIEKYGVYYPNNSKSSFVADNKDLLDLYNFMLDSFNAINGTSYDGLIYSFMDASPEGIKYFNDYKEFERTILIKGKGKIETLWNQLYKKGSKIIELNYEESFNPLYIDINDFQYLMPPFMVLPPYKEGDREIILEDVRDGIIRESVFPSWIIQAHSGYIKKENICNIYNMFPM